MMPLLAALLFASPQLPSIDRDAVSRYVKECPGEQTPQCKALRVEAEMVLIFDFWVVERGGGKLDPAMLRLVARLAATPQLRMEALRRLLRGRLEEGDEPAVFAAVNSPYPGERRLGVRAALQLSQEKRGMLRREYPGKRSPFAAAVDFRKDNVPPNVTVPPGAEPFWFASGADRTWLVTSDPPSKAIAFFAKDGRKALTASELDETAKAATSAPDPMELMRLARTDPEKFRKLVEKVNSATITTDVDPSMRRWTKLQDEEGVTDPRFVILEETPYMMGKVPTKVVAVFKDEVVGKTSIVFVASPPPAETVNPASPDFMTTMKLHQIVNRPPDPLDEDDDEEEN